MISVLIFNEYKKKLKGKKIRELTHLIRVGYKTK